MRSPSRGGFWLLALAQRRSWPPPPSSWRWCACSGVPPRARMLVIAGGWRCSRSLPWFASYLMPDLYAGLLILAAATLAFAWASLRRGERLGLIGALPGGDHLPPVAPPARRRRWPACVAAAAGELAGAAPPAGLARAAGAGGGPASARDRLARLRRGQPDAARPAVPAGALLGGRPGPGLSRGRLPGSRLGDLRRARPAGADRAGVPLAPGRQLLEHGACRRGRPCGPRRRPSSCRRCWPTRWASCAHRLPTRPLQLGRFGLDDFVLGRGAEVTRRGLHLRLSAAGTRRASGASAGSRGAIYVTTVVALLAVIVCVVVGRRRAQAMPPLALFVAGGPGPERRHLRGACPVRTHAIRPA